MNVTFLSIACLATIFLAEVSRTPVTRTVTNEQTKQNLSTAMHGEAFAFAKYKLFAEEARGAGDAKTADLFEQTARTERFEHFREEARLAGLTGTVSDNLKDALKGESYETETMYREFAEQAEQAGEHEAAQRFEEIRKDEAKHRDAFAAALTSLRQSDARSR